MFSLCSHESFAGACASDSRRTKGRERAPKSISISWCVPSQFAVRLLKACGKLVDGGGRAVLGVRCDVLRFLVLRMCVMLGRGRITHEVLFSADFYFCRRRLRRRRPLDAIIHSAVAARTAHTPTANAKGAILLFCITHCFRLPHYHTDTPAKCHTHASTPTTATTATTHSTSMPQRTSPASTPALSMRRLVTSSTRLTRSMRWRVLCNQSLTYRKLEETRESRCRRPWHFTPAHGNAHGPPPPAQLLTACHSRCTADYL